MWGLVRSRTGEYAPARTRPLSQQGMPMMHSVQTYPSMAASKEQTCLRTSLHHPAQEHQPPAIMVGEESNRIYTMMSEYDRQRVEEHWAAMTPRTQLSPRTLRGSRTRVEHRKGKEHADESVQSPRPRLPAISADQQGSGSPSLVTNDQVQATSPRPGRRGASGADLSLLLDNHLPPLLLDRPEDQNLRPFEMLRQIVQSDFMRIQLIMHRYDKDGSGEMDRFEFRRMVRDLLQAGHSDHELNGTEALDQIYNEIDRDASGCISFQEIHKALRPAPGRSWKIARMVVMRKSAVSTTTSTGDAPKSGDGE